ncbi:MAG: SBBP repeat-containing protein, partial [Candidatus Hydrogenedens sp.]|nr:SBBP repeat-containing protein [Candidatus Hydrogenedens sp.]
MQNARLKLLPLILLLTVPSFFTTYIYGLSLTTTPLFFKPNLHRFSSDVLFYSSSTPISVACYKDSIIFHDIYSNIYLKVSFNNSNAQSISGSISLSSYSCYFDKYFNSKNVPIISPHYKAVIYKEIYPNIDLYLYENSKHFEFDFIIYPHANWNQISLNFDVLSQNTWVPVIPKLSNNKIIITYNNSYFEFFAPCAFQWINGQKRTIPIKILNDNGINFNLSDSNFNPNYPLILDPTLLAGTYLGGNNTDKIIDVKVDSAGNIYLIGETKSPNFPTSYGVFQSNFLGGDITGDIFVTKMNPTANQILFSTFLGGSGDDSPTCLEIDSYRNIYIAGITSSSDFPITANAYQNQKRGNRDSFFVKLSSTGQNLIYSSYIGGSVDESIMSLDILPNQQVILTG